MYNRKKRQFYRLIIILLLVFIPFISIGYSALQTVLNINSNIAVKKFDSNNLFEVLSYDSCYEDYEGNVTDEVGVTKTATMVRFPKCVNRRNVLFGGFCWQIVRTTETGGIKMIYNGEPDQNGSCGTNRAQHKGIVQTDYPTVDMVTNYLYGDSFSYDTNNNTFTLLNTYTSNVWYNTYMDQIGKFTCKSNSNTCTTLYQVNGYGGYNDTYVSTYTIGNTYPSFIGTGSFNANYRSPAMAGYMFNISYNYNRISPGTTSYKYANSFTYNSSTNTYTLSGTSKTISNWTTGYNQLSNTHYTCWNTTGTCQEISYVYNTDVDYAFYFVTNAGYGVNDVLNKMLFDDAVNTHNSSIKGIIDNWYVHNLNDYTNMLENAVYCNARNINNLGGWNPNGGLTTDVDSYIKFKNYTLSNDLTCTNITDQFSVDNSNAKLTYPVFLLQDEELYYLSRYPELLESDYSWWSGSPVNYSNGSVGVRYITTEGTYASGAVHGNNVAGIRPLVSLKNSATFISGDGSEESPWVIDDVSYPTQIKELIDNETCIEKYEGEVTDKVGLTKTSNHVYFNRCANERNIIFNNMCWQMIRTTESGGIKMIYNGDVVDGKCLSTRDNHKGIVQSNSTTQILNSSYLYGNSFTYDTSTNKYTLLNTISSTWSDSTYENLIGKFTCKSNNATCSTIYQINGYVSNTEAYASAYTIDNTNYAGIGTSSFNANYISPAMVGYMFNKVYELKHKTPGTTNYKFGSSFTYTNGTYTLSGTTKNISDWSTGYNQLDDTHYTCWNTSGFCSEISFIYYSNDATVDYINLTDGKGVDDALTEMLSSNNVNKYDSSIKGILDNWYRENLSSVTNMLEDTVYCNARNIISQGGWSTSGNLTTSYTLRFKNYETVTNLACPTITDQFSITNNKAKLIYPVGLLEAEEGHNINSAALMHIGAPYWRMSPYLVVTYARMRYLTDIGGTTYEIVNQPYVIRPVITLKNSVSFASGSGSEESPWVVV